MIIRIVTLQFDKKDVPQFIEIFKESQPKILAFDGCSHVELLQANDETPTLMTYSHWESEDHLNAYRKSEFFGSVWPKTKSLLVAKPHAISVKKLA